MDESNRYNQNYSFDHYDDAPPSRRTQRADFFSGLAEKPFLRKFRSPVFAMGALLVTGAAFAALIVFSYPDTKAEPGNVPIVRADASAFKEQPFERGGMSIPNTESTVFSALDTSAAGRREQHRRAIENLLASQEPQEEALQAPRQEITAANITETVGIPETVVPATQETSIQATATVDTQQTIIPPETIHAAGSSPETLAFVRSVLDKKDAQAAGKEPTPADIAQTAAAENVSKIEPAAGFALAPGNYFVQLGSVRTSAGADGEWKALQKTYAAQLQNASYRVQEANLGDKGIYYRIQAGPMSKESATSICNAIKAQKPGGCMIVGQ
ncbi:MAG: SPOR domain-containing protein [Alphaproteobacteria bacterium]|nr:SPOR domain-containing protein [Alphaproteobacteria bacterium]